jgi:hypothetical protein
MLNKEMYFDSFHVQILHDRLIEPICRKRDERLDRAKRLSEVLRERQFQKKLRIEEEKKIAEIKKVKYEKTKTLYYVIGLFLVIGIFLTTNLFLEYRARVEISDKLNNASNLIYKGDISFFESESLRNRNTTLEQYSRELTQKRASSAFSDSSAQKDAKEHLEEAIDHYRRSLAYIDSVVSPYERLIQCYLILNTYDTASAAYDSVVSVYARGIRKDSSFVVLFQRTLALIDQSLSHQEVTNKEIKLVNSLFSESRRNPAMMEKYLAGISYDLLKYGYGDLGLEAMSMAKEKTPYDYITLDYKYPDSLFLRKCINKDPNACECYHEIYVKYSYLEALSILEDAFNAGYCKIENAELLTFLYKERLEAHAEKLYSTYEYILQQNPRFDYYNSYAWNLALNNHKLSYAETLSLKSITLNKNCWYCWDTLAEVYLREGKIAKAEEANNRALKLIADDENSIDRYYLDVALERSRKITSLKN